MPRWQRFPAWAGGELGYQHPLLNVGFIWICRALQLHGGLGSGAAAGRAARAGG